MLLSKVLPPRVGIETNLHLQNVPKLEILQSRIAVLRHDVMVCLSQGHPPKLTPKSPDLQPVKDAAGLTFVAGTASLVPRFVTMYLLYVIVVHAR